ncbi:hypothetical protein AWENTII_011411 [Aspergillus wentii]
MRPQQLTKRACDECISRKVKCSGAWPCDRCQKTTRKGKCTYLKPARRRGPKVRRYPLVSEDTLEGQDQTVPARASPTTIEDVQEGVGTEREYDATSKTWSQTIIPRSILASAVRLYQEYSYSVWPVIKAEALLQKLENGHYEDNTYCLATALSAATMAQLHLAPLTEEQWTVDSSVMAAECIRIREQSNYRESLDARCILASFFLHVYHAKINQRNSAMIFIQEAISGARLLRLDVDDPMEQAWASDVFENREILFPLLWVSERGYSMHLGLAPSYTIPVRLPEVGVMLENVHVQGLLELVRLFVAFDRISVRHGTCLDAGVSPVDLAETEATLSALYLGQGNSASTRMADYYITREWMRTIVWQKALSLRLLSSTAYTELMTFDFPALVSRDLLQSLRGFSESDLLPLGRDQLLKCFEVANSLADTVLFTSAALRPNFQLGPSDFLHALYQKILPFLEQDPMLKSILRAKTAEALVKAPGAATGYWI